MKRTPGIVMAAGVLLVLMSHTALAVGWTGVTPLDLPRFGLRAEALNGSLYAIGGHETGDVDKVERFDPSAGIWETRSALSTERNYAASGVIGGRIFVAGGYCPGAQAQSSAEVYDESGDTWTPIASMPAPNTAMASTVCNDRLYLFGGDETPSTTLEYDPASDQWMTKSALPHPRSHAGAAALNGLIYVVGGTGPSATVDIYDPVADSWSAGPDLPVAARAPMIISFGGKVWAVGGQGPMDIGLTGVYSLTPGTAGWMAETELPEGFGFAGAAALGNCLYTVGGLGSEAIVSTYEMCVHSSNLVMYPIFALPASATWYGSGIEVQAGDSVAVRIEGLVNVSPTTELHRWVTPNGVTPQSVGSAFPEFNRWAVLGRIAGAPEEVFFVGAHHGTSPGEMLVAHADGELEFQLNDDILAGNEGVFMVEVHVHPRVPVISQLREYAVITFDPSTDWMDTGVDLRMGELLGINADGLVSVGGVTPELHRVVNADGVTPQPGISPYGQFNRWALLGRIGDDDASVFQAGSHIGLTPGDGHEVAVAGRLKLRMNDDVLGDNVGRLFVKIIVLSPPSLAAGPPADGARWQEGVVVRVNPNPFRASVAIQADVPQAGPVSVDIYDVTGRLIRRLETEAQVGRAQLTWDGRRSDGARVPVGNYIALVRCGRKQATQKIVQLR